MSDRVQKKWRRFMRKEFAGKINKDANLALRCEIFRLARNRDILGVALIVLAFIDVALLILLVWH